MKHMRTVNFKGYWFGFSDVTLSTVLRKTRKINTLYSDISKLKIFFQQQRQKEIVISWTYLFMQQVCHKIGINFFHFMCFNFMVSIYWGGFLKLLIWVTNLLYELQACLFNQENSVQANRLRLFHLHQKCLCNLYYYRLRY